MKVVSQDGAIASLIFIPDEIKPLKGFYLPDLLGAITKRYQFVKPPSVEEARTSGAKFETGKLHRPNSDIAITTLGVFNDVLSVTTTDTSDSEFVLEDLFTWLKTDFKFRDPVAPLLRVYQSDLVVKFDNDPSKTFDAIRQFLDFIQLNLIPENARTKKAVEFNAILFGADPVGPGPTPDFTIARRVGVPWHLGLYFSKAHMKTSVHIRALEILDGLLAPKKARK